MSLSKAGSAAGSRLWARGARYHRYLRRKAIPMHNINHAF